MAVPPYDRMFNHLLAALRALGGSATNEELAEHVAAALKLTDVDLEEMTKDGTQNRFEYRLAWARSYLKGYGLITNSERGVWTLTEQGRAVESVDPGDVKRTVRARSARPSQAPDLPNPAAEPEPDAVSEGESEDDRWEVVLSRALLALSPEQFERLCQRVLRESGFTQVTVTGRPSDGGIDGIGNVRLGGLLSFPVLFQCKRYQGSVGASVVRDFRGAMVGRADRGLILTTGVFTRDAKTEASRDGAPPVDLVDGTLLIEKLKELRLGVTVEHVERVTVDRSWFTELQSAGHPKPLITSCPSPLLFRTRAHARATCT